MSTGEEPHVTYRLPKLYRFVTAWFFFLLFLNYDPTGISHAAESWLVRVVNYIGAPFYQSKVQENIIIVMADKASLGELGWTWPLGFDQQAAVIGRIAQQKPRILALDLLFLDERAGEHLDLLQDGIDEAQGYYDVPVIGAAPPRAAGIDRLPLPFKRVGDISIDTEWPGMGYHLVKNKNGQDLDPPSLAYAMYEWLCNESSGGSRGEFCDKREPFNDNDYEREMLVFWGSELPDYKALFGDDSTLGRRLFRCREDPASFIARALQLVLLQRSEAETSCAFHVVLPLDIVMKIDPAVLRPLLEDKIVFYGLSHPGIPDVVTPPTSQPLPGVHLHAMALDNLLTYGPDYFGAASRNLLGIRSLGLDTIRLVLAILLFITIFVLLLLAHSEKPDVADGQSEQREIADFSGVRAALLQLMQRFGPTGIRRDIAEGFADWNRRRDERLMSAGRSARALVIRVGWLLGLLPVLVGRTATGRVVFFLGLCALIVYLDIYVLMVPPVDALTLVAILGASQLIVPAEVFSPRSPHRGKRTAAAPASQ